MNISTTIRFVCFTILLLATQFRAAAQNSFTDAEADGIKAFLLDNFRQTNACMVIGLFKDSRGLSGMPGFGVFGRTAMDGLDRAAYQPSGMELLAHAGGAGSYHAWVGFDKKQRRGVVVLTTANDVSSKAIGWTLLQRRPLKRENANEFAKEIVGLGFAFDLDKQTQTLRVTKVFLN